ncbi:MAG: GNAT family N-acetyltransferase [Gemmatimonadaceae bacterium]|nr:GNAT family N-acetyltransferase [Gemmatimonadaceae bacterium]
MSTGALTFRRGTAADLPAVVAMLADDALGAARERSETPLPASYADAFAAMEQQGGNELLIGEINGEVVACLQLIILPGISLQGATRAQIEGVRVASTHRGQRLGEALVREAMARARNAGCTMMQLSSNVSRTDARRFYERLGFVASHIGMKCALVD